MQIKIITVCNQTCKDNALLDVILVKRCYSYLSNGFYSILPIELLNPICLGLFWVWSCPGGGTWNPPVCRAQDWVGIFPWNLAQILCRNGNKLAKFFPKFRLFRWWRHKQFCNMLKIDRNEENELFFQKIIKRFKKKFLSSVFCNYTQI